MGIEQEITQRMISRRDILRGVGAFGLVAASSRFAGAAAAQLPTGVLSPVRFAVIGDWGCGDERQMAVADRMARVYDEKAFELVLSVGDNIYPNGSPEDFARKFERPYDPFICRQVPFYTVFGNHDVRSGADAQLRYPLFNMKGNNYYSLSRGNGTADFFMLDSTAMDARQLAWIDRSLGASQALWKVVVVHHPPYSSGKKHGSKKSLRKVLEPILVRHKVDVVFSGDDHVYQRVTPQQGVQYFVTGAAGKIRHGDLKRDALVASGFDDDNHFMVVDADATRLAFRAIAPDGRVVDSGELAAKPSAVAGFLKRFAAA